MINFNFLTPFQLTTFVLGIVFSILTIAMVFYTLRHPRGYRNNILKVIFTFILPSVTIIMWFMCIFAAYEIFESELYTIFLSMGCGAAVAGLTYLVAWLINKGYGKTTNEEETEELEAELAEVEEETVVVENDEVEAKEIKTEEVASQETEVKETETTGGNSTEEVVDEVEPIVETEKNEND